MRGAVMAERPQPRADDGAITATVKQFAQMSGLGPTSIYALFKSGDLQSVTIGRRRLIILDSYRDLLRRRAASCSPSTAVDRGEPDRVDGPNDGSAPHMARKPLK